jgi:ribonuclease BN (tRNA processing enzyme)
VTTDHCVRVLGCAGAIAAGRRTTSFLVGRHLLVDAGTGVGELTLDELCAVDHVVLTHSHLDHIAALPLMADSVLKLRHQRGQPPVSVHALPQTLAALQQHVFNNVIWPDFTRLPSLDRPVICLQPLQVGDRLTLAGYTIEALPASHTVPAVGYAIWPGDAATHACWVFTGDTGPNPRLWDTLSRHRVAQLVIETAFQDADHELAQKSQHLHPQALLHELQRLRSPAQIYITHMKPGDAGAVEQDMLRLGLRHKVTLLQGGECIPLGA